MFREAEADDFDAIAGHYRQLHPRDPVPAVGDLQHTFEQLLATPGLRLFVLELDGVVVATTYLDVIPNLTRSVSPSSVIENVVVEESRRGHGLGKQIMAGTLRAAWDEGCDKAMLMTGSKTSATHALNWARARPAPQISGRGSTPSVPRDTPGSSSRDVARTQHRRWKTRENEVSAHQ